MIFPVFCIPAGDVDLVRRPLLGLSMTPDLSDDSFVGNTSGLVLQYKFRGIQHIRRAASPGPHGPGSCCFAKKALRTCHRAKIYP